MIGEEEDVVEVETVDNDALQENECLPLVEEVEKSEKWYKKASLLLDYVNKFSKTVCVYPGFNLSIDKMIKLLKGRPFQTVRMKCKPIKEGFKFYAIYDYTTGFVYFFLPDGMKDKYKGTVVDSVVRLMKELPDRV